MAKVAGDKDEIVTALPVACADETKAVEFMEAQRWDDTPACPRCGDQDVYQMKKRGTDEREASFRWRCRGCKKQYSVRTGTVFEESRIPLQHWCYAFWRACTSKKGVSALEIKRQTGLSYKSALFMMHRIRYAMAPANGSDTTPLEGIVEVDETYIGGKPRHAKFPKFCAAHGHIERGLMMRSWRGKLRNEKTPVVAMVERGGRVRARVVTEVTSKTLRAVMDGHIALSARLMTDELRAYHSIGKDYASHETVQHTRKEYGRGDVTTNTVEGFFSLLKRGLNGTFHAVSREHLHRYVSEFEFRYSRRHLSDGQRVASVLKAADGKRLRYRYGTEAG